ncbi:hypothetical protein ACJRO7_023894 [Eucalyptus globulus]|uniref:Uncharacterized protein n=1 Tax=Eucalyptus globulus TaxID=34317 RepID=A0ABD3K9D5_EUCGL
MSRSLLLFLSLLLSLLLAAAVHGVDNGEDSSSSNSVGDKHEDMRSKSLILAKIWCLTLVFVGTFDEAFLLQGTYVASGFFLATAMMRFPMDDIKTLGDQTDREFSSTVVLSIAGILLTMLAHFAVSYLYGKQEKEQRGGSNVDLEVSGGIVQGKGSSANGATHHHNLSVAFGGPSDGILLIIALCLHSVFLGIAIGVAETKPDAWKTMRTIFPHNIFAAVAMGIVLLRTMPNRPLSSRDAYAFAYAISSSIGMAIGIVIDPTTQGVVAGWSTAIFLGFCGMFLYVSAIFYRYMQNMDRVGAFLATMVGVGIIVGLMFWDAYGYSAAVYLIMGKRETNTMVRAPDA